MKFKKVFLSLFVVVLTLSLSPKLHAVIRSVDVLETAIRNAKFYSMVGSDLEDMNKIYLLEEINRDSHDWRDKDIFEVKQMLRTFGIDEPYWDSIGAELLYVAASSSTVDEVLENLKNMEEAYRRVYDEDCMGGTSLMCD